MTRHIAISLGFCLAVAAAAHAQDPVKTNPSVYHVAVDNAQVRVLHVAAPAGGKTTMHQHPDNITVLLTDGTIVFTGPDGKSQTVETKAGQALWSGPQTHSGANTGKTALEAVVVELKGSAAPKAVLPASRANLTRTALVENARADAFRFTADAGFKEAAGTTHDYDQVLIATGPTGISVDIGGKTKSTWKRGDVLFIGRGQPHQAQNTSGKPQDMIAVVIK
jgi:quercetin dioxygenase-like cupin family protein